ncbi:MAG: hypothetical protein FWD29_05465 [Micrococcales bacterium]|nr:hypothetical protein [Micrococcales bacterium]
MPNPIPKPEKNDDTVYNPVSQAARRLPPAATRRKKPGPIGGINITQR